MFIKCGVNHSFTFLNKIGIIVLQAYDSTAKMNLGFRGREVSIL
jgi:hypothetical protein